VVHVKVRIEDLCHSRRRNLHDIVVDAAARTGVEYEAVAVPHERTMEQFSVC